MKLKIILSVLLLFSLLKVDANPLVDISIASGKEEVFLHSNDIPFEILTTGKEDGSRSVIPLVPFVVFVEDSNYSVELDFMEGIGVVEIAISQNGSGLSRFLAGIIFYTREVLLTSHYEKRLFEHASQPRVACADIRLLSYLWSRTNLSRDSYQSG